MRKTLIWTAVGLFFAVVFSSRGQRRERRETEQQPAAATVPSPEVAGSADDGDMQDGIERLLGTAKATKEEDIDVSVDAGKVTLSGHVGDPAAAQVAEALAESYPGVKGVHNEIELNQNPGSRKLVIPIPLPSIPPIVIQRPGAFPGHPPGPPSPGTPEYEAVADLLKEGKKAIEKGDYEEAMAIYGAALSIDNRNQEARRGMQEAARQMRARMRSLHWAIPAEPPPAPPVAPVPRTKPVPQPSPDGEP